MLANRPTMKPCANASIVERNGSCIMGRAWIARLEEDDVSAFAEGHLAPPVVARIEAHAVSCTLCQDLLAAALATATQGPLVMPAVARPRDDSRPPSDGRRYARARARQLAATSIPAPVGRGGMGEVYAAY